MTVDMAIYTSFAIYTVAFLYGFLLFRPYKVHMYVGTVLDQQNDVTLFLDETVYLPRIRETHFV